MCRSCWPFPRPHYCRYPRMGGCRTWQTPWDPGAGARSFLRSPQAEVKARWPAQSPELPEIRPSGRKPFAPGLVTVAGASIANVPKLLAFSSPSLLSVSPDGRVQDLANTLGPRGGSPKFSEITTGGGKGALAGSITGASGV